MDVTLGSPGGELDATFMPALGMVCSSLRHRGEELLGQRGGPAAYAERGSSFGIPLLHPWANRLSGWSYDGGGEHVELPRDSPLVHLDGATGLPMHGLLAASPHWSVITETATELAASFDLAAHADLLALFPFPHRLDYRVVLDDAGLTLRLTLTATGEKQVPISFGFHPYLAPPGVDRREWEIAVPVNGGALDGPLGDRAFDDSYETLDSETPEFAVSGGRRRLAVRFLDGYTVAQVYAPENSPFIAFEPMTAPVDALRTGAGLRYVYPAESFTAEFAVTVAYS